MDSTLEGRAVVVTGESKGIGKGIARVFVRAGADVMLCARDAAALEATAGEIGARLDADGGRVEWVAADVSTVEGCARMAEATATAFGGIDVLCANAGIFPDHTLDVMTEADLDRVLAVNVKGTVFAVQACLPALRASGRGRVVVTSSITGPVTGYPGWSHYGASKAAQLGFVRTAALELARDAITVNAVLPGNVRTEGLESLGADYEAAMTASIPLGRLGTVDEIGHACLYLASEYAAFVTGQTIVLDGGQVLPESLT